MFYLREIQRSDIPSINKWRNDSDLIDYLGSPFRYINEEVDEKWFLHYMDNRNTSVRCAIIDDDNPQQIIGVISLTSIDWINRNCSLHIMIGDKRNQNKGAGSFAVCKMLEHAFLNMNMFRVELEVLETNQRAINLYKKAGFSEEGIHRACVFKNGEYCSMIHMSVLSPEWKGENNHD